MFQFCSATKRHKISGGGTRCRGKIAGPPGKPQALSGNVRKSQQIINFRSFTSSAGVAFRRRPWRFRSVILAAKTGVESPRASAFRENASRKSRPSNKKRKRRAGENDEKVFAGYRRSRRVELGCSRLRGRSGPRPLLQGAAPDDSGDV